MWFMFGFITLILFTALSIHSRFISSWKGVDASVSGLDYHYLVFRTEKGIFLKKDKIARILIGVTAPFGYHFSFKWERWYDRFFKKIGLSREYQVGDREFDELVYIVSDDYHLLSSLPNNQSILDALDSILGIRADHRCHAVYVRCQSGRLWVLLKPDGDLSDKDVTEISHSIVPRLHKLSEQLNLNPHATPKRFGDPFAFRAALILSLSSALAINGAVHMARLYFTEFPLTIDYHNLLITSVIVGTGITIGLIAISIFVLGPSARTHLVVIELALVGLLGSIATTFVELREANIENDDSVVAEYHVHLTDKYTRRGRRYTNYYFYVEDWTQNKHIRRISVPHSMYMQYSEGDVLLVKQHYGFLHYRWIEEFEKKR